jgi:hypothetical protein
MDTLIDIVRDVFSRSSDQMLGRMSGPLHVRLIIMLAVVAILAIRAGWIDARRGQERKVTLRTAWQSIKRVIIVASVIDLVYQFYVFHAYFVFQTIFMVLVVAVLPYIVIRSATARLLAVIK